MSRASRILGISMIFSGMVVSGVRADEPAKKATPRPEVEVVFCLDTTGSMGGLINAAKQKIWAISNQIASGQPTPRVKIGLVAYRDRGDTYITKIVDLTDDLDAIHTQLMSFQAQAGGDFPESVNQALNEAVTKISWSKDKKTLKMIFLVGDAPPHMDYPDDVKYPETCKLAVTRDIIINTVQCGNHAETKKYWLDIFRLAEGSYVQIDAHGGPIVAVATPFDADLAKINRAISETTLVYGTREAQREGESKKTSNAALAPAAAADRAAFYARGGAGTSYDLLKNVQDGTVKLETLKKDELPPQLQKLNLAEQKTYLKNLEVERRDMSEKALQLNKQRNEFIAKKQAEDSKHRARDTFDNQVLQILRRQATRNGNVQYGSEDKR
jgi:Mg-chelatase subunit ChlD